MTPKNQWLTMGAIALVVISAIHSCSSDHSGSDSSQAPARLSTAEKIAIEKQAVRAARGSVAEMVDASAIERITPDDYPKMFKRLGKTGADAAYKGATVAAWRAVLANGCQEVQTASVTMQSSKKHMEFFVNCLSPDMPGGAAQWRFKESELKDAHGKWYTADNVPAAGISDTAKNITKMEADRASAPADYMQCEEAIKNQLDYPSAAEFHNLAGRADFVNPQNENVIKLNFEAKADSGAMLPFVANCIFHHDGTLTADIYKR